MRTRLEEQERIAVERQRRMAERMKLHKEGLNARAGEADLGDVDMSLFMEANVDTGKVMALSLIHI